MRPRKCAPNSERFLRYWILLLHPDASPVQVLSRNYYSTLFYNSSVHNEVKDLQKRIFEFSSFLVNVLGVEDLGATLSGGKATYHGFLCGVLRENAGSRKNLGNYYRWVSGLGD